MAKLSILTLLLDYVVTVLCQKYASDCLGSGIILKYDRSMEQDLSGMSNLCHGLLSAER